LAKVVGYPTATCKIIGNRSTDFNGFLYQFTTGKTFKTVARFPIILQIAVPESISDVTDRNESPTVCTWFVYCKQANFKKQQMLAYVYNSENVLSHV
jgi:hypothetical protein